MQPSNHYLIHLPHCGTKIPNKYREDYLLTQDELTQNIYQYSDLYTDELFDDFYKTFGGVKNSYSRLFFDPERFGDDEAETMQQKFGLGWFYENAILSKKPLRKLDNKKEIRTFFDAHHKELNRLTQEKLDRYNRCSVIDCHSFSNERYWFHDKTLELPDICIGFEERHVDSVLVDTILEVFKGYDIKINTPYAGSLVPTNYWQKDSRVKSVMIEINKKIYLEADNITKSKNYTDIKERLDRLLENIVAL